MLIAVNKLKDLYPNFESIDNKVIERKLKSIESAIRQYTHNNFQNTFVRLEASTKDGAIQGTNSYLKAEDTVEISDGVNKGLYTIKSVGETIETKEPLYDYPTQLITKIEYPDDVVEGAIDLLDWELIQKGKENTGVASESISRHSVNYVQRNDSNTINGYPAELFNFCKNYMRARF